MISNGLDIHTVSVRSDFPERFLILRVNPLLESISKSLALLSRDDSWLSLLPPLALLPMLSSASLQ